MRLAIFSSDILNDELHHRLDQYNREAFGTLKAEPRITECIKKTKELYVSTFCMNKKTKRITYCCCSLCSVYQYQRQRFTFANFSIRNQKMRPSYWQKLFTNILSIC